MWVESHAPRASVQAAPLHPLWLDFTVLGAWLVVLLILGVRFWRWE